MTTITRATIQDEITREHSEQVDEMIAACDAALDTITCCYENLELVAQARIDGILAVVVPALLHAADDARRAVPQHVPLFDGEPF